MWYGAGMPVPELELAPRIKGRATRQLSVEFVREVEEADYALLASSRGSQPSLIKRLRDRHHALARLLAQGMKDSEVSLITGYDLSRISILKRDPTFQQLLSDYEKIEDGLMAEFQDRASLLTLTAMNNLQERLEDEENPLPAGMELEIAKTFADRTGHAPVQRNLNLNANVDLGTRLSQARERVRQRIAERLSSGDDNGAPGGPTPPGAGGV